MSKNSALVERSAAKPASAWRVAFVFILGCCGVIALVVAFGLRSDVAETRAQFEQFTTLPAWPQVPQDGLGTIDGEINGASQTDSDGFIAWVREAYRSEGVRTSSKWELVETMIQPFEIATSAGLVKVTNADYRLDDNAGEWSHQVREVAAPTMTSGAVRMRGLLPSKPVTVIGRRTSADQVSALSVAGMTRANYVANLDAKRDRMASAITILFIAAPLGIAYAIWETRRLWRQL